ncbi:hypothetical protein DY000_02003979 [Brassica cretica]|uniref:Uncharacterized protein n=1 Tax=Brassica cretica TaxID=69181 RepID=A0ABQ7CHA0_BRACR|nr:hypothetical protein DY000_02003979 [Brassica cretica]
MALLRDSHPLRGDEIGDYLSLRCSSTRSRRLSPWLSSVILTLSVGLLDGPLRWAHSLSLSYGLNLDVMKTTADSNASSFY